MSSLSPNYLPNISIPIENVLNELSRENVKYSLISTNPNELKTSQPFILSSDILDVKDNSENNPIWIDSDNNIIDGHVNWVKSINNNNDNIKCIKINLNFKDSCRILNKILDIYEYKNYLDIENNNNDFISNLNYQNKEYKDINKNIGKYIGYRNTPIKENSSNGNYFMLTPVDGYDKYEIEFDNILDLGLLGIEFKNSQNPIDVLSKLWFPDVNFEELKDIYSISSDYIKSKAVIENAIKMGFDGIKYNDKLIHAIK